MKLRPIVILVAALLLTLPLMVVQQVLVFFNMRAAQHLPRYYFALLCKVLRVKVEVIGELPKSAPALFVGNHVSWLDIPIIGSLLPATFVAKKEIGTWPFISHLAKLQGTVFVDRLRRQTVLKSRNEMQGHLKAGQRLVLFPEGTSHTGKTVLGFKSSFFSAVEGLDVPVIPFTLVFSNLRGLPITQRQRPLHAWYGDMELGPHVWEALLAGPLHVKVMFHAPLKPERRKAMARAAHATIKHSLISALHARTKIS